MDIDGFHKHPVVLKYNDHLPNKVLVLHMAVKQFLLNQASSFKRPLKAFCMICRILKAFPLTAASCIEEVMQNELVDPKHPISV